MFFCFVRTKEHMPEQNYFLNRMKQNIAPYPMRVVEGHNALVPDRSNYSDYSRTSGLLSRSKSFVIHPKQEKGCWRCALSQDFTGSNSIGLPPKEKFLWEAPKANFIQYFENMSKSTFSNGDMLFCGSSSGPMSASHFAKSVSQHL